MTRLVCEDPDIEKAAELVIQLEEKKGRELPHLRKAIYECMTDEQRRRICLACIEDETLEEIFKITKDPRICEIGNKVFAGLADQRELVKIIQELASRDPKIRELINKLKGAVIGMAFLSEG